MIKNKGNISQALIKLPKFKNAISNLYENAKFSKGDLDQATFTIKANFALENSISSGSSLILENFCAGFNATVVDKLIKSGAAMVAQTHGDEFGLGGTGLHSAFGKIYNPLNSEYIVGGSSSGAAATLIDEISIAVGSDTGDSVRTPASFVGKVGFKPSYGAISRYGLFAFASSLDTVGFLTHNVHDAILASQASFGFDKKDFSSRNIEKPTSEIKKPKKVAYIKNLIALYNEEYQAKFFKFIESLKQNNIEVIPKIIDEKLLNAISITYQIIGFSEASSNLANLDGINFGKRVEGKDYSDVMTNTRSLKFGKTLQRRLTLGAYFLSRDHQIDLFQRAQKVRRIIVNTFNKIYQDCDLIISIATPIAPKVADGKMDSPRDNFLIHSNFEGSPSIVIPFENYNNMPFGLSIDAAQDQDKMLLSNALFFKKLLGGQNE